MERILVQEVLAQRTRAFKDEPVLGRQRVDADQADDLLKFGFLFKQLHRLSRQFSEILGRGTVEVVGEIIDVQRIRI